MLIYCVIFGLLLFSLFIFKAENSFIFNCFPSNLLFKFIFVFFFIIVAFRDLSVGTDTFHYNYGYQQIVKSSFDFKNNPYSAPFYYLLCYLCGFITDNGISIRIIQAGITYYCFYKLISKVSEYKYLSIFLFFVFGYFASTMNGARQIMANSMVLYAIYLFHIDKKYLLSILLASLGVLPHITSFVALSIPLLWLFLKKEKNLLDVFLVSIFIAVATNFLYKYIAFLISENIEHYKIYTTVEDTWNMFIQNTTGVVAYLFLFYISIIVTFIIKSNNKLYDYNFVKIILPFVTVSSVFGLLNPFNQIIYRVLFTSNLLIAIVLIPNTLKLLNTKEKTLYICMIVLFSVFMFCYDLVLKNGGEIVPYSLISF